jgi:glucosyl-dolichyl phosphate glucuronosyltransferase
VRSAQTQHMIPPSRMTQKYLNKRFANQGNCDCYTNFRRYGNTTSELKKRIQTHRFDLIIRMVKFLITIIIGKDKWHVHRAYLNYYANCIKYDKRLIADKQWVEMVRINDWINI